MAEGSKAVSAGRGVLYIAAAKIYFLIAGAAIEFLLPGKAFLGVIGYGAYGFVAQWVSNFNNVMVTGTIQAVSRYTTAEPERAAEVRGAGVTMQLMIGVPLAILFVCAAPLIARASDDPGKTGPLMLAAGILGAYSFYAVFVGSANGARAFNKQAGLDITFATLRAAGILGASILGLKIWGAIGAWAAAAVAILFISTLWIGLPKPGGRALVKPMAFYLVSVALYLVLINFIMSTDQLLLKPISSGWFTHHADALRGLSVADAADKQVGIYRGVQNLARLPYQLMIAVTFVVFPLVSRAVFEKDVEKTRGYIKTTLRYSLVFAGAMGIVLAAVPGVLAVPYARAPEIPAVGSLALVPLALGNVAFAVFTIAGTILNGAGKTGQAIVCAAITLALLVGGLFGIVPHMEAGRSMLFASGMVSSVAMLVGAVLSGALLWRGFGAFLPVATVARVAVALGACLAAGHFLPHRGKIVTLAEMAAIGVLYLAILVGTRELGAADLRALRRRSA